MGDMADFTIEQGMAEEEYRADHPYEFEEENSDCSPASRFHYTKSKSFKICRQCGLGGLHWQKSKTSGGWRLYDKKNEIHNCSKKFKKNEK